MSKFQIRSFIYYFPIVFLIVLSAIIPIKYYSLYTYLFSPLFWLIFSISCYYSLADKKGRFKYKKGKTKTVLIITLFYLIFWFSLGLIFGYVNSSYSHSLFSLFRNLWCFVLTLVFKEYVRMKLIENDHSGISGVIIVIIFTLSELSLFSITSNMITRELAFKYFSGVMFPIFVKNILITYLVSVGGINCVLAYIIPIATADVILPIFPDLDWFFQALISTFTAIIIGISINHEHQKKVVHNLNRKNKRNPLLLCSEIIVVLIFALFVAGVFKYRPIAVLTYSMKPVFTRGDTVIIEKLNEKQKSKIKVNDVVQYQLDDYVIIHRVIKIEKDRNGNLIFTTKGDHNQTPDDKKVKSDQIIGIARCYIPKIGYPSVWLSEFFDNNDKDVGVET